MSNQSLYLVQSTFAATDTTLSKLAQIYSVQDTVILMGEAVLKLSHPFVQQLQGLYILDKDAEILVDQMPENVTVISYAEFADICLQYTRCIRLN